MRLASTPTTSTLRQTRCTAGSLAGTPSAWTFHLSQPTERHLVAIAASAEDGVEPRVLISSYRVPRAGTMEGMEDMEKDL